MATKKRWSITEEEARNDALKCKTRTEFAEKYSGSWRRLSNISFVVLDKACSHMTEGYIQWSPNKVQALALTCKTRNEFKKKHNSAWLHMQSKQLQDLCYEHMGPRQKPGRKRVINQVQVDCSHEYEYKGRNQHGILERCSKCKLVRTIKFVPVKTEIESIIDLINSKVEAL